MASDGCQPLVGPGAAATRFPTVASAAQNYRDTRPNSAGKKPYYDASQVLKQ